MKSATVIDQFTLPTANRGDRAYIVSVSNGRYYAHELGELTQFAKVFGTGSQKAHSINPTVRRGNQHGRYFRPRPFASLHSARIAAQIYSQQTIIHA